MRSPSTDPLPAPLGRRTLLLGLGSAGLLGAGLLGGCAAGGTKLLNVGSQKGANKVWMEASGALKGAPYRVEWSEFPAAQHLLEAIGAGAVDVGGVGDAPFLFAYESGNPIVAVQATRYIQHVAGSAVLVRKDSPVHAIADLRGKKVATGRGSAGHQLLLRALEQAKLTPGTVEIVFFAPGDAKAAFETGAVDAWSTWNPYVAGAVLHSGARIVADGRDLGGTIGFMVANARIATEKHAILADFLARNTQGQSWASANRAAFAALLARETGLPLDVAQYTANRDLESVPMDARVQDDLRRVLRLYKDAGAIAGTRPIAPAFDTSFDRPAG